MRFSSLFKPSVWKNYFLQSPMSVILPDKVFLKIRYRQFMGKKLNLDDPKTYNEKLQWLKLYDRHPFYSKLVDKISVREYVKEKIGEEYLIPVLGVWDAPEEIDFDALPDQFVLKCNHNSGLGMYICTDKSKMDKKAVINGLKKGLRQNYYLTGREWPYKNVPHKILAENYIKDEVSGELEDYKLLCFGGKPAIFEIHRGRFTEQHKQDFFDTDWNVIPVTQDVPCSDDPIEKPALAEEMKRLSAILSNGIPHVRVDWYIANGRLYFGEMTFFDGSGFCAFYPDEYDRIFGDMIVLPEKKNK